MDHREAPKLLCCNNICTIVHCCNGEALNFYLVTTYAPLHCPFPPITSLSSQNLLSQHNKVFFHKVFRTIAFVIPLHPLLRSWWSENYLSFFFSDFPLPLSSIKYIKISTSFCLRFPLSILPRIPSPSISDFHQHISVKTYSNRMKCGSV